MCDKGFADENVVLVFLNEFIRVKDVVKWCVISFFGFLLGLSSLDLSIHMIPLLVFLTSTFCIMSFTFAVNNYYDAESDRRNPRRMHVNAIASGKISRKTGVLLNLMLVVIPLFTCFLFKFEVFLLSLLFLFLMWSYSAPPFRLKGRPGLDIIWHFSAFVLIVIWGSFLAGSVELINWLVAISIGVFSCIGQVSNHIIDYEFDKESGTKTYAVKVGLDKAKTTLKIFIGLHLILLIPLVILYTLSYAASAVFVVAVAVLGFFVLRPKKDAFPTRRCFTYYFGVVVGGAVYGSCLIYRINVLLGTPMLHLL